MILSSRTRQVRLAAAIGRVALTMSGFSDKGKDCRGRICDFEGGKWYRSILKREPSEIAAQRCILVFCRTEHWTSAK